MKDTNINCPWEHLFYLCDIFVPTSSECYVSKTTQAFKGDFWKIFTVNDTGISKDEIFLELIILHKSLETDLESIHGFVRLLDS